MFRQWIYLVVSCMQEWDNRSKKCCITLFVLKKYWECGIVWFSTQYYIVSEDFVTTTVQTLLCRGIPNILSYVSEHKNWYALFCTKVRHIVKEWYIGFGTTNLNIDMLSMMKICHISLVVPKNPIREWYNISSIWNFWNGYVLLYDNFIKYTVPILSTFTL